MQELDGTENENANRDLAQPSNNDLTNSSAASPNQSRNFQRSEFKNPTGGKNDSTTTARKATGPRTAAGKKRSKSNALKNGLFSTALILENESPTKYKTLLIGLREDRQPEGYLENLTVNYLATLYWRRYRYLRAENTEIKDATHFKTVDSERAQRIDLWDRSQMAEASGGILKNCSNPLVLEEAISTLGLLRVSIELGGIPEDENPKYLLKLYGLEPPFGILQVYKTCQRLATEYPEGSDNCQSPDDLKKQILEAFDHEIRRLQELYVTIQMQDESRKVYQNVVGSLPCQDFTDRFIRADAHLSREIDRTLNQLERLQRMRRGQPVFPSIKLEL